MSICNFPVWNEQMCLVSGHWTHSIFLCVLLSFDRNQSDHTNFLNLKDISSNSSFILNLNKQQWGVFLKLWLSEPAPVKLHWCSAWMKTRSFLFSCLYSKISAQTVFSVWKQSTICVLVRSVILRSRSEDGKERKVGRERDHSRVWSPDLGFITVEPFKAERRRSLSWIPIHVSSSEFKRHIPEPQLITLLSSRLRGEITQFLSDCPGQRWRTWRA